MQPTTLTGSYISFAAILVSAASYFGFVLNQDAVVTVIAGGVALYGIIHQLVVVKNANTAGLNAGYLKK